MIEKIQKANIPQRIWIFIVGKTKPNLLTQISVAIGLCIWFYLFSWHLITLMTLTLMNTLPKATELHIAFNRIGNQYQTLMPGNITTYLFVHSIAQILVFTVSLLGLILIWRQKKIGFLLYIFSNIAIYLVTLFIMGIRYMSHELSLVDFLLLVTITLYFSLGYWLFYRNKSN